MSQNTGNNIKIVHGEYKPDIEAIIAHTRTALLTKLRDEVEGLDYATSINMAEMKAGGERIMAQLGFKIAVSEVLALLEKGDE